RTGRRRTDPRTAASSPDRVASRPAGGRPAPSRAERDPRGLQPVRLDLVALGLRARDQLGEPGFGHALVLELEQRPPEAELAVDPERQDLELHERAEGRVADQLPVQLEPAALL